MFKVGFSNEKYVQMQSQKIRDRIGKFGGKLYLEFGGKLFDDYHASRVLPGFEPDSKVKMLMALKDEVEIVIAINADAIEKIVCDSALRTKLSGEGLEWTKRFSWEKTAAATLELIGASK